jgi:hypothetical protein
MERAKAINLVRKLRTLAASEERLGNVAAGNAARVKAAELRDKYGISAAELDGGALEGKPPPPTPTNRGWTQQPPPPGPGATAQAWWSAITPLNGTARA